MSSNYAREMTYPFRINTRGEVASTTDLAEAARSRITTLLLTGFGDRVMRPSYGTSTRSLLFDTESYALKSELRSEVMETITNTETSISVVDVNVTEGDGDSTIEIEVFFTVYPMTEIYSTSAAFKPTFSE